MKKENRLKKRKEFAYIFKKGESYGSKNLVLVISKSKLPKFKVGFSVSKKVGVAVIRNKVKRRLKEAVYFYRKNIKNGFNMIFVAKQSLKDQKYVDVLSEVESLLRKANLYQEEI
ncbi:MAG: ribonuclease P protein component [Clostridiales bacterium]|nr:ribonuclease P protein component [Candidatus Apopatousia equi]